MNASQEKEPAALKVTGLGKSFMGVAALQDVDFSLTRGKILGLIGPNGSGKSTALDCMTGFVRPDSGQITLDGQSVFGKAPHTIARSGLARTFQTVRLYDELTLDEHVELALHGLARSRRSRRSRRREADRERAMAWLTLFGLERLRTAPAGILSYGQKKLLTLASILGAQPRIVMLDEPLAGVNPRVIDLILDAILQANKDGQTFLIIEHNVEFITSCCSSVVVLDAGRKLAEGPPSVIWEDPAVYEAFLGRKAS
ncbi:branched-chain amino acid transport system ATP-binding protein [Actinomadura mexicana]|uniref:Branched-chain amino acid transport system ATP-binding protein n=2 Tax=Actinomadura mexicana TaxID=134959 RepID=A0A238XE74_9ACTN|nr:branched-chain amino acid transport system ATP-binding protein [Actinomadura mexicana]